jgi:cell filamentation protein
MKNRYDVSHLSEGQFEPGSKGQVLKNLLGIKNGKEMESVETAQYERVLEAAANQYRRTRRFTARDLLDIHREWLGEIYPWAGTYRQVNISKGDFPFAVATHIPSLMNEFEKNILAIYTPCQGSSLIADAKALAVVHAELMLIHPFREGNGRLGRILANLMALQAGFVPLDYWDIDKGKGQHLYFAAVRAAVGKDYQPMQQLFEEIIRKTMRKIKRKRI